MMEKFTIRGYKYCIDRIAKDERVIKFTNGYVSDDYVFFQGGEILNVPESDRFPLDVKNRERVQLLNELKISDNLEIYTFHTLDDKNLFVNRKLVKSVFGELLTSKYQFYKIKDQPILLIYDHDRLLGGCVGLRINDEANHIAGVQIRRCTANE